MCGGDCAADADSDGICDDEDDCVGELDACGICNGPGAIYDCGCSDIPEGDCDCDGNQLDAIGVCGGDGNQLDAACVVVTPMRMASATTRMTALASLMLAAFATDRARFTTVDVLTSQKVTATATATV